MESPLGSFHPTRFADVAVTIDFHCNSACRFCIVQEGMNRFGGVPFERFMAMVEENKRSGKYQRVIFTGGEVTLDKRLGSYIRAAKESGTFQYIRLQTNARRLAHMDIARALVEEGLNEFFVSIHGHDAQSHDDITQRKGSFDELIAGLSNIQSLGARLVTNTVINRRNLASLPHIVSVAAQYGVQRMEFWNYLPMEDFADERDLIAPINDIMTPLKAALSLCKTQQITAAVKYIPMCLLGEFKDTLDNSQPDVIIVEDFWNTFPRFNCLYEALCEHSDQCLGVHHPYIHKFGWETEQLTPTPRTHPWTEQEAATEGRTEHYSSANEPPPQNPLIPPAWEALVAGVANTHHAQLQKFQLTRNQARYTFTLASASIDLVLSGRDEHTQALARSKSFNIFYAQIEGVTDALRAKISALIAALAQRIIECDQGQLTLDTRKGLLQVLPPAKVRRTPK
jgi:molybdenum cofactor biosynthesis enzyme MoaA